MDPADEAMARHADGDPCAFGQVVDAVAPCLAESLRPEVRDPARLEDLVRRTFLHMHRARGTFIPGAAVLPWAIAIARSLERDRGGRDGAGPPEPAPGARGRLQRAYLALRRALGSPQAVIAMTASREP